MDRFVKTLRKGLFKILPQYTTLFHSQKHLNVKKPTTKQLIIALHGFFYNHQQRGEIQFFSLTTEWQMARIIMFPSIRIHIVISIRNSLFTKNHAQNMKERKKKHKIDHIIIIITVNLSIRIFI